MADLRDTTAMIRTDRVRLSAGGRVLVDALDWHVAPGDCWCVIGCNGAGKSTLLRALAGLAEPAGGSIAIGGRPVRDWPPTALARLRGFLPQSRSDAFGYRVIETVLAARHPYLDGRYWEGSDDHAAAHAALASMDVAGLAWRDIRSLSGGERQRVAIAALLAQDTQVLLLDEPTAALDLAHQAAVVDLLARLRREPARTVVMVAHDLNLAHAVASHVLLLMGDGRWHAGRAADIMQPALLGACLGHPIETMRHRERTVFLAGRPAA